ncbi:MAG: DUF3320 domain-containing protein [Kofleriaceae bacterium]|nr:DUF3320 domain-containing protein [Kofleriaceae bacterium]
MKDEELACARLESWKRALIDQGPDNPLLDLRLLRPGAATDGAAWPLAGADPCAVDAALAAGVALALLSFDSGDHGDEVGAGDGELRALAIAAPTSALAQARAEHAELARVRGAHALWLGLGLLHWIDAAGVAHRAPLGLRAVVLRPRQRVPGFRVLGADDVVHANRTVLECIRTSLGLTIPVDADGATELATWLGQVEEAIATRPGWRVERATYLGVWPEVSRQLLWADLAGRADAVLASPVAGHLARASGERLPVPTDALVDAEAAAGLATGAVALALDADADQLAAIASAGRGASFVLHGPPGAGKSQTVAGVVAHALGQGKTVLVVAGQEAALSAAQRRLVSAGIGDFCLPLHGDGVRRGEVLAELGRVLERTWRPGAQLDRGSALDAARATLDGAAQALHAPGPLGMSVHDALAELATLRDAPRLPPAAAAWQGLSPDEVAIRASVASAYARAATDVAPIAAHPWRSSTLGSWGLTSHEVVGDALHELAEAARALAEQVGRLVQAVPGARVQTRAELEALGTLFAVAARSPRPGVELIAELPAAEPGDGAELAPRVALVRSRPVTSAAHIPRDPVAYLALVRRQHTLRTRLAARWSEAVDRLDAAGLAETFRRWSERGGVVRFVALRAARAEVRRALLVDRLPADLVLAEDLEVAAEERVVARLLAEAAAPAKRWFADLWTGDPRTLDLERAEAAIAWARELRRTFDGIRMTGARDTAWRALVAQVAAPLLPGAAPGSDVDGPRFGDGAAAVVRWRAALARLAEVAGVEPGGLDGERGHLPAVLAQVERWQLGHAHLRGWAAYVHARGQAMSAGLAPVVAACESGELPTEQAAAAWRRALLLGWAEAAIARAPALAGFHGVSHHAAVAQFVDLDRSALALAKNRLLARLSERAPRPSDDIDGQVGTLLHELRAPHGGDGRALPQVLAGLSTLLPRLKPCVLVTPLAAARLLPAAMPLFDLVVVDEASLLSTAEAIGAVARGRAAVIVGDARQLPPARAWRAGASDAGAAGEPALAPADLESILDECVIARLPQLSLRGHYRSRHHDLMAWPSRTYYADALRIWPSAVDAGPQLGVAVRTVEPPGAAAGLAEADRAGALAAEADAVVHDLLGRLREDIGAGRAPSLAVVALTPAMAQLVRDRLTRARQLDPAVDAQLATAEASAEPLQVTDVAGAQGLERDRVLLALALGRADGADLAASPLAAPGGERRLLVALTRAREQLVVFSTVAAASLPSAGERERRDDSVAGVALPAPRGITDLAAYLRGHHAEPGADAAATPICAALAHALEARGWQVRHQVGVGGDRIDLAIVDPDDPARMLLAIELDGPVHASYRRASDRERLRPLGLAGRGWRTHRIWALDWWADPERELTRAHSAVIAAVAAARQGRRARPTAPPLPLAVAASGPSSTSAAVGAAPTEASAGASRTLRTSGRSGSSRASEARPAAVPARPARPAAPARANGPGSRASARPLTTTTVSAPVPTAARSGATATLAKGSRPTARAQAAAAALAPAVARYQVAPVPAGRRRPDDLFEPRHADELGRIIDRVLTTEAPVSLGLLSRRVGAYFGVGRVTQRVTEHLRTAVIGRGRFGDEADVIWRLDQDPTLLPPVRVATESAETRRDIDEVPIAELAGAALVVTLRAHAAGGSAGVAVDDLVRDAARLLGFARLSERIGIRVRAGIDHLDQRGAITLGDDRVTPA